MRTLFLIILLLLLSMVACADGDEQDDPSPSPILETPTVTATARPSSTPRPTATASPTPTPQPAVEALAQSVDENGELVASRVYAPQEGWLVVYADDGGEPGEVLGQVALEPGEQRDVVLSVDPFKVTEILHLRLHEDTGEQGAFDFPQDDAPLEVDGAPVGTTVPVDLLVSIPAIGVADQTLGEDGVVLVDAVVAAAPGWVAVHADDGGAAGELLGVTPVDAGESLDVVVRLSWRETTRRLHAVLYVDEGQAGQFEPQEADAVVAVDEQPVAAVFTVQAPPDIFVINQPVVAAEIVVERAFVNQASWIVVFSNYQGFTDRLLGYAALEAGENLLVTVPIEPGDSTDILHVQLHEDGGVAGEFEYPADDAPLRDDEGQPVRASFETDTGNYLLTRDQALGDEDAIEVPLVVSDLDTWVVVWTEEDGQPGEIIGQTAAPRGVQRDVLVSIERQAATETLYVVLHQDAGLSGEFEYPGPDEILLRERSPIQAPFQVQISD